MNPRTQRRAEQRIDKRDQKRAGKSAPGLLAWISGFLFNIADSVFSPRGLVGTVVAIVCYIAWDQDLLGVLGLSPLIANLVSSAANLVSSAETKEDWNTYAHKCEACRVVLEEAVMASFDDAAPLNVLTVPQLEPDSDQGKHISETVSVVCSQAARWRKYPGHMQRYCESQIPGLESAIKIELHTQDGDRKAHEVVQDLVRSQCHENLGHCTMLDVPPVSISSTWGSADSARKSGVSSKCEMCAFTAREIDGLLARLDGKITDKNQEYVVNTIVAGTCNNTVIRHPELLPNTTRRAKVIDAPYTPLVHFSHTPLIHSSRTLLTHSSHTLLSYTPLIHSSHTLLSYTPLVYSSHTLLSHTPLLHSSHTLLSYTPLIHSSHTLLAYTKVIDASQSVYTSWCFENLLLGGGQNEKGQRKNAMLEGFVDASKGAPRLLRLDWNCARWDMCTKDW
jgi:hypothetical protein